MGRGQRWWQTGSSGVLAVAVGVNRNISLPKVQRRWWILAQSPGEALQTKPTGLVKRDATWTALVREFFSTPLGCANGVGLSMVKGEEGLL